MIPLPDPTDLYPYSRAGAHAIYTEAQMYNYGHTCATDALEAAAAIVEANAAACTGLTSELLQSQAAAIRALKETT